MTGRWDKASDLSASSYSEMPTLDGLAPLSERLYEAIEAAIISEQLQPGQHLQGDDLAQHFGVSRIPVREALRELSARGWVEIRPRQGAFVRQRTVAEMEQLFELRAVLEAQSVRWAAARRTEQDLFRLDEVVRKGRARPASIDQLTSLNAEFHAIVVAASRNDLLAEALVGMSKRVRWYFAAVAEHRQESSWKEHARLVDALRRQDADSATELILRHVDATHGALRAAMVNETTSSTG